MGFPWYHVPSGIRGVGWGGEVGEGERGNGSKGLGVGIVSLVTGPGRGIPTSSSGHTHPCFSAKCYSF